MDVNDVAIAIDLTRDMHFIVASRTISDLLNIPLDMAYDLVKISRMK